MTRFILLRRILLDYRVRNTVGDGAYTPKVPALLGFCRRRPRPGRRRARSRAPRTGVPRPGEPAGLGLSPRLLPRLQQ
jgi:hypothetical protein